MDRTPSGGQPAATSDRVYTSSAPKRQARFPHRKTTIRGYGRNTRRRIRFADSDDEEAPEKSNSSPPQKTLTQLGWIEPSQAGLRDEENEEDEENAETARPYKRRRKTEGDVPSCSPPKSKSYHTQTLTQMGSFTANEDDLIRIDDSQDENESCLDTSLGNVKAERKAEPDSTTKSTMKSPNKPRTPTTKRVRLEIPSSQDSPISPMIARYSPAPKRSPLKAKSTNIMSPLSKLSDPKKLSSTPNRPRSLVVEDSYTTVASNSPTSSVENRSPAKPSTQAKSVRFATPGSGAAPSQALGERAPLGDITEEVVDAEEEMPPSPSPLRPKQVESGRVIADSDDDGDFDLDDEEDEAGDGDGDGEYGALGDETQRFLEGAMASAEKQASSTDLAAPSQSPPLAHSETSHEVAPSSAPDGGPARSSSLSEVPTVQLSSPPRRLPRKLPSSPHPHTRSSLRKASPVEEPAPSQTAHNKTQHATQGLESQRIHLDVIRSMAPQTDRSDIFISIHPQHVEGIVSGVKDHEYRKYKIPNVVSRMWIYVTAPVSELRYMAAISNAKQPGEIADEKGAGNAEFNRLDSGSSQFAYELLELYELNNPVSLEEMKENGWIGGPPQKYNYVPPAVVGHLMANLRCSVWGGDEDDKEDKEEEQEEEEKEEEKEEECPYEQLPRPASSTLQVTVSQEVTNQIMNEATQHQDSDPNVVISSSQDVRQTTTHDGEPSLPPEGFSRPRQFSSSTPHGRPANPTSVRAVRPSQATTVSQLSSPSQSQLRSQSQSQSPSKPASRPQYHSSSSLSLPQVVDIDDESPVQLPPGTDLQLGSSQLLTKSQMLPDSLREQREQEREQGQGIDDDEVGEDVDIVYDSEG